MNRWISVKDRLPEIEKDVLVCEYTGTDNKVIEKHVAFYNGRKIDNENWGQYGKYEFQTGWEDCYPDYWMPLPPDPPEDK